MVFPLLIPLAIAGVSAIGLVSIPGAIKAKEKTEQIRLAESAKTARAELERQAKEVDLEFRKDIQTADASKTALLTPGVFDDIIVLLQKNIIPIVLIVGGLILLLSTRK